jgi:hypothetical protein
MKKLVKNASGNGFKNVPVEMTWVMITIKLMRELISNLESVIDCIILNNLLKVL